MLTTSEVLSGNLYQSTAVLVNPDGSTLSQQLINDWGNPYEPRGLNSSGQAIVGQVMYTGSFTCGPRTCAQILANVSDYLAPVSAHGINNKGEIAGDADWVPLIWSSQQKWTRLPIPAGYDGEALDINDAGWVVGSIWKRGGPTYSNRAVAWAPGGRMMFLGPKTGLSSAYRINNNGAVLGYVGNRYFIWNTRGGMGVGIQPIAGFALTHPYDMNELGQIVGYVANDDESGTQAVIWDMAGRPAELPSLSQSGHSSMAFGINNSGCIVGEDLDETDNKMKAVVWTPN